MSRTETGVVQHWRRRVLPALHPLASRLGRPLIRDKTHRKDEFVCRIECPLAVLDATLRDAGWRQNPLSTLKYRDSDSGRQWEVATWVWRDTVVRDVSGRLRAALVVAGGESERADAHG